MDIHDQKEKIRKLQPLSKDELFEKNSTVCVIPSDWWTKWCSFVGFFGFQSGDNPGDLETNSISLSKTWEHSYLSVPAWKQLKTWYKTGKKIEILVANNTPDTDSIKVRIVCKFSNKSIQKSLYISLKLSLFEIKAYICDKFKEDPEYIKLSINEYGSLRKLKDLNGKFERKDLINKEIHLLKASRPQVHSTKISENTGNWLNTNELDSTGYQNEEQEEFYDAQHYNYEGVKFNNQTLPDFIDYDEILKIKDNAIKSFQDRKEIIKIRSLKTLQKNIQELLKTLPL